MPGPVLRFARRYLDIGQAPQKADIIFVFAGRPERKRYGLRLFRRGYADQILISVGRFEWRRFPELGLEDDGGLVELVNKIPPQKRHFFVHLENGRARCFHVQRGRFGTLSEAVAVSQFIKDTALHRLLAVSSATHLRRATASIEHFCPTQKLEIIPVATPSGAESASSEPADKEETASDIWKEFFKCFLYRLLLLGTKGRSREPRGSG